MHPISTILLIVGYGLSIPIAFRLGTVVKNQQRLAFGGHQLGVVLAMLGWVLKQGTTMLWVHLAWLVGTRVWFSYVSFTKNRATSNSPDF